VGNRSFWEPAHELVREQSADGLFPPWPRQEWLLPPRRPNSNTNECPEGELYWICGQQHGPLGRPIPRPVTDAYTAITWDEFNVVGARTCVLKPLFDKFGSPFGNHHRSDVGVSPDHVGHHRRVHHP